MKILLHGKQQTGTSNVRAQFCKQFVANAPKAFSIFGKATRKHSHFKPIFKFMRKTDLQLMCIYVRAEYNIDLA
jgi:hypothetical protein